MNYRRTRRQSKRSRYRKSRRNRRGGAMDDATLIRAYNNWAIRRDELDEFPLASGFNLEGGDIILFEKRKESDGVNNRMLARFNTASKKLEIISGDPDHADLVAEFTEPEIYKLARNE